MWPRNLHGGEQQAGGGLEGEQALWRKGAHMFFTPDLKVNLETGLPVPAAAPPPAARAMGETPASFCSTARR